MLEALLKEILQLLLQLSGLNQKPCFAGGDLRDKNTEIPQQ